MNKDSIIDHIYCKIENVLKKRSQVYKLVLFINDKEILSIGRRIRKPDENQDKKHPALALATSGTLLECTQYN